MSQSLAKAVIVSSDAAEELHASSLVWNACDTTSIKFGDEVWVSKLAASGVSACFHTVGVWEPGLQAFEEMAHWRNLYASSKHLRLGLTAADALEAKKNGQTAVYMAWQDITPLEGRLPLLDAFYQLGLRIVQPTYQNRNLAGDGCGERVQSGLSKFGVELVKRCNQLGIILDISHVGDATSIDILEHSTSPVMATHVGVRGLNDTVRNKPDDAIKAIAKTGGVVGIAGKSGFLLKDGLKTGSTLDDYIDHVAYIADLVGIDHVGIGTDVSDDRRYTREFVADFHAKYPEVKIIDESLNVAAMHPDGLKSPADLGNITKALARRGFSTEDIKKVIGGNVQRVVETVLIA